ncbi:MAG: hypothetical protein K1X94_20860 [Sandaracinaceae bacterium]|nr:hypothetical protein [Sandaracinaceae bacterium]
MRPSTLFVLPLALTLWASGLGCANGRGEMIRAGDGGSIDAPSLDASLVANDAFVPEGLDAPPLTDAWAPDAVVSLDARSDCTGSTIETCATTCGSTGTHTCSGGHWGACMPPTEACNARDDDCDGMVDDGLGCTRDRSESCTTSCGSTGMHVCSATCTWGTCTPPAETCNGRDDDCDGTTDDGSLCAADESCVSGVCRRTRWVFEAESDLAHAFGRAEADGWSAATGPDARGTWIYGPYTTEIPGGAATATFRLMVDNRSADNGVVVRIEVNDFDGAGPDCGDCVIASRDVRRMEFAAPMAYQDFVLGFTAIAGHRLELRTYWSDISYVREDRVVVTSP